MMFYGTKGNQNYNVFPAVTFKMSTVTNFLENFLKMSQNNAQMTTLFYQL